MSNSTPTHDEIAAQAYQIYLREGCVEGRDLDHWLQAEHELRARSNGNGNGNGNREYPEQENSAPARASAAPRNGKPESILSNSVVPPTSPIAQVTRSTTPRRTVGKRETAAAK